MKILLKWRCPNCRRRHRWKLPPIAFQMATGIKLHCAGKRGCGEVSRHRVKQIEMEAI
ncbi:MAG: hypothetical protein AB1631_29600 [Acidobacteriota bacterium]